MASKATLFVGRTLSELPTPAPKRPRPSRRSGTVSSARRYRLVEVDEPLEISTIGNVPTGTGLGSSGSLTCGLLKALHAYRGQAVSRDKLAEQACRIEYDIIKKSIGRLDQYAAFGALIHFHFNPDDTVDAEPVPGRPDTLDEMQLQTLLLYAGQARCVNVILERKSAGTADKMSVLRAMRDLAGEMRQVLIGTGDLDAFADLLHRGWELKKAFP